MWDLVSRVNRMSWFRSAKRNRPRRNALTASKERPTRHVIGKVSCEDTEEFMFRRLASLTAATLLAICTGVAAQESASSGIVGLIVDSTKAGLPGATVTVINAGTNAQ